MATTKIMRLNFDSKLELLEKLEAIKKDISVADEKYQHAFARGDFNECGIHRNTLSRNRNLFAIHKKYQIKRGWL